MEKVKGSIATMLTLASSQGDGLYKELAGKYAKALHKGCLCRQPWLWLLLPEFKGIKLGRISRARNGDDDDDDNDNDNDSPTLCPAPS